MTSYNGGKIRIGKRIAHVIYNESQKHRGKIKGYCEPCLGMAGVYRHIPNLFKDYENMSYKAGDINPSTVAMWQDAKNGWKPPTITSEEEYNNLKNADPSALKGYIGHQYAFGGQFFKGFAPKYGKNIDSSPASQRVVEISKQLKDVKIIHGDYRIFSDLRGYIIYCDPPYKGTYCYYSNNSGRLKFDSNMFWAWARSMSRNNMVFISSYNAPSDFREIWSNTHKLTGIGATNKIRTERLFTYP